MKKIGLIVGGLAVLLVIGLAAAWALLDVNRYRGVIQTQLEQKLGRKVALGEMRLHLLPLRFEVANPVIAEDPQFATNANFVRAENLAVQANLLSLLQGKVQVDSIELKRPSVELLKDRRGRWNFSTLAAGESKPSATAPNAPQPRQKLALGKLSIIDGRIAITDAQQRRARAVYDHVDVTLLNFAPDRPFSFDVAAHLEGAGREEIRLNGTGGPLVDDNPAMTPLQAKLTVSEVDLAGLKKFFDTEMLKQSGGSLSGESELASKSGQLKAAGKLALDRARLNGMDIGYPITLDYDLEHDVNRSIAAIHSATLRLGQTPVSVAGSVDLGGDSPVLHLNVKSGDVSIAEISRLASAFGAGFAPGATVNGRVAVDLAASGDAASPVLTGSVRAHDLQLATQGAPQPVQVKALDLALSPNEIRSNEFNASSGKTTVAAKFAVRDYRSKSPSIDAQVRAPNATLPEIRSIAKAYGFSGLEQLDGAGSLNLDMRASGALQSLNSAAIMRALNGAVNLDFSPVRVLGFDAANELARIGGFAPSQAKQAFTDIARLTGHIVIKNGIAQTDDLRAQLGLGNLAAAGTADLAASTLNMKVSAVLSKEFSDKVGGSRAGGYMRTMLANEGGELVIPAIVTGSFNQPKFAPDLATFAQMQKQRLLPSLQNPAGALTGLLKGLGSNKDQEQKKDQPQNNEEPEAKPTTVKGILKGLLGGAKQ